MAYFVVRSGEGGTRIKEMSEHQLERELRDGEFGGEVFIDRVPENDGGCWRGAPENAVLIIRGDIVVPKPVTTSYRLP